MPGKPQLCLCGLKHFITVFLRFVFLLSGIFLYFQFLSHVDSTENGTCNKKGCKRIMLAGLLEIGLREPWAYLDKFGDQK